MMQYWQKEASLWVFLFITMLIFWLADDTNLEGKACRFKDKTGIQKYRDSLEKKNQLQQEGIYPELM